MKNINEYLSSAIKNKKYIGGNQFPRTQKYDVIKKFLLDNGFKEYSTSDYESFVNMTEKRFNVNEYKDFIEIIISDNGKTTDENPEFTLFATKDGSEFRASMPKTVTKFKHFVAKEETYHSINDYYETIDDFADRVNEFFKF